MLSDNPSIGMIPTSQPNSDSIDKSRTENLESAALSQSYIHSITEGNNESTLTIRHFAFFSSVKERIASFQTTGDWEERLIHDKSVK